MIIHVGVVAQLVERYAGSVKVRGSIPLGSTTICISTYAAPKYRFSLFVW